MHLKYIAVTCIIKCDPWVFSDFLFLICIKLQFPEWSPCLQSLIGLISPLFCSSNFCHILALKPPVICLTCFLFFAYAIPAELLFSWPFALVSLKVSFKFQFPYLCEASELLSKSIAPPLVFQQPFLNSSEFPWHKWVVNDKKKNARKHQLFD